MMVIVAQEWLRRLRRIVKGVVVGCWGGVKSTRGWGGRVEGWGISKSRWSARRQRIRGRVNLDTGRMEEA